MDPFKSVVGTKLVRSVQRKTKGGQALVFTFQNGKGDQTRIIVESSTTEPFTIVEKSVSVEEHEHIGVVMEINYNDGTLRVRDTDSRCEFEVLRSFYHGGSVEKGDKVLICYSQGSLTICPV